MRVLNRFCLVAVSAAGLLLWPGPPRAFADSPDAGSPSTSPDTADPYRTYTIKLERDDPNAKQLSYSVHLTDTRNLSASAGDQGTRQSDYIEIKADIVERPLQKAADGDWPKRSVLLKTISASADASQDLAPLAVQGATLVIADIPYSVVRTDGKPISAHDRVFIDRIFKYHGITGRDKTSREHLDPTDELHIGDTWTPNPNTVSKLMSIPGLFTLPPDQLDDTWSLDDRSIVDGVDCLIISGDIKASDVPAHIPGTTSAHCDIEVKLTINTPLDEKQDLEGLTRDTNIDIEGTAFAKTVGQYDVSGNFDEQVEISNIKRIQ